MASAKGTLYVTILRARNLPFIDGKSAPPDPFIKVVLSNSVENALRQKRRTNSLKHTREPVWLDEEMCEFKIFGGNADMLQVEAFDGTSVSTTDSQRRKQAALSPSALTRALRRQRTLLGTSRPINISSMILQRGGQRFQLERWVRLLPVDLQVQSQCFSPASSGSVTPRGVLSPQPMSRNSSSQQLQSLNGTEEDGDGEDLLLHPNQQQAYHSGSPEESHQKHDQLANIKKFLEKLNISGNKKPTGSKRSTSRRPSVGSVGSPVPASEQLTHSSNSAVAYSEIPQDAGEVLLSIMYVPNDESLQRTQQSRREVLQMPSSSHGHKTFTCYGTGCAFKDLNRANTLCTEWLNDVSDLVKVISISNFRDECGDVSTQRGCFVTVYFSRRRTSSSSARSTFSSDRSIDGPNTI